MKENIFYPFKIMKKKSEQELNGQYLNWMEVTELTAFENHYPHEISGGMKQKVAISRCFLTTPDIAFLDEPFKSLEMRSKRGIAEFIGKRYRKVTLLWVTHSKEDIALLPGRLFLFENTFLSRYRSIDSVATDSYQSIR